MWGVPSTGGNPSGRMRRLINEVRTKAVSTCSKVVLGGESYSEHSGWKDEIEDREQKLQGTE